MLKATVRQEPDVSRLSTSALLERGRDGIDLPLAAVVAGSIAAAAGRVVPWLEAEKAARRRVAYRAGPTGRARTRRRVLAGATDGRLGGSTLAGPRSLAERHPKALPRVRA